MQSPLLETKLHIPRPRPELVARPRLDKRLDAGLHGSHTLALVSAPAGYGKTTLLSEWVHRRSEGTAPLQAPVRFAWLSLDEGDNDPKRFLSYLVAALQTVERELGRSVQAGLKSPAALQVEALLIPLLNELAGISQRIVLVLDDYHAVASPTADRALSYLLDHLPSAGGLHLVIATRTDPTLPLSRLRARGQLTELRQADLRFTHQEAATYLHQVLPIPISADDIRSLGNRTEGWITGLQLAAMAMQGLQREQARDLIQGFGTSHRYVIDYLVDEVLDRQTPEIHDFLLQTSILERMAAPLCQAVTGREDSQQILEHLEAANLFLTPLDDVRSWYRYHHLFAVLLRQRLAWSSPERIPDLHRQASAWYEREGQIDDAVHHARAAGDTGRATEILEEHWQDFVHRGELDKLERMLVSLGQQITRSSAPLCMAYCWISALRGEVAPISTYLSDIREVWGAEMEGDVFDRPMRAAVIPSLVETMEAIIALDAKQPAKAKQHARRAISLIPENASRAGRGLLHGAAGYRLALAHKELGEVDQACVRLREVLELLKASGNYFGVAGTVVQFAGICTARGRTSQAVTLCQNTLDYMKAHGWHQLLPSGMVYVALAGAQAEAGELEEARRNLETGQEMVEQIGSHDILKLIDKIDQKLASGHSPSQPLVEPLSPRELEVLQLIAEGYSNREIGERLFVAMSTVKGHNRRIFGKLQVQRRTKAVARARELGLLQSQSSLQE